MHAQFILEGVLSVAAAMTPALGNIAGVCVNGVYKAGADCMLDGDAYWLALAATKALSSNRPTR